MATFLKQHRYPILLGIGIFIFVFIFFTQIHPVYPYDLDDWKIMHRMRSAYPSIFEWNPTRILPEFLMPRCGEVAMTLFYPLCHDITLSIGTVTSLLLASLISAYIVAFYRVARKAFSLSVKVSVLLSVLFFAFHFLIFRSQESENQHLFYSYDLTDHYFYTVPNLLASICVLLFISERFEYFSLRINPVRKGFFLLLLYLTIFSNLFDSIILAAFIGCFLLFQFCKAIGEKRSIREFAHQYWLHLAVISLWLVAIAFEPFGGNSEEITTHADSFPNALMASVKAMKYVLVNQTNRLALALIAGTILSFAIVSIRQKEASQTKRLIYTLLSAAAVSGIFLTLLGAASFPYYLLRIMSVYAVPFFLILAGFVCASILLQRFPHCSAVLPLLLLIVYCDIECRGKTFQDVQTFLIENDHQYRYRVTPQDILKQNRQYIQAIIEADQCGKDSVTLTVPRFEQDGNWPLSWSYGRSLSKFLYINHLIAHKMTVNLMATGTEQEEASATFANSEETTEQ